MNMKSTFKFWLCLTIAISSNIASAAEKQFGDYIVHYNAFASDFLSPEIASAYGITRSRNVALLNVTILKRSSQGERTPIDATLEASAVNLLKKNKPIKLRRIAEDGAIYHIAEFDIVDRETLNFTVIAHDQNNQIGTIKFRQQFFK